MFIFFTITWRWILRHNDNDSDTKYKVTTCKINFLLDLQYSGGWQSTHWFLFQSNKMKTTKKFHIKLQIWQKLLQLMVLLPVKNPKVCIFHGVCKMGERKSFKISHITQNIFTKSWAMLDPGTIFWTHVHLKQLN